MTQEVCPGEPTAPAANAAHGARHTLLLLVALYALAIVWGLANALLAEPANAGLPFSVAFAAVFGSWAVADARRRGHPLPLLAKPWFFFFYPLLIPLYVLWTRRWRGLGWLVLHSVLWSLVAAFTTLLVGLAAHGPAWLSSLRR